MEGRWKIKVNSFYLKVLFKNFCKIYGKCRTTLQCLNEYITLKKKSTFYNFLLHKPLSPNLRMILQLFQNIEIYHNHRTRGIKTNIGKLTLRHF